MDWRRRVTDTQAKTDRPIFGPGDQVRVWCRILERDRVRLSPFEGVVVRRRGAGASESFTVRRMTYGEGVERVFPLHAPIVERIDVIKRGKVRRARLYYLRRKIGKTRIATDDTTTTSTAHTSETPAASSGGESAPPSSS